MRREFLLNILFLVFINLLIKPFFIFGIDRTIQNRVGLEEYGIYAALFNFTFLLSIINDFGIQTFNNQHIAQKKERLITYFPNILILKILLGFTYVFFVLLAAFILGYAQSYAHLLAFLIINQILLSAILYFRSNISALGFYRIDSLMTVLERVLLISICAVLLWANPFMEPFQIAWFIYAQTWSLAITAIVAFSLVYRQVPYFKFQLDCNILMGLLKKSAPFALVIFLMTVYTRIDFVMIERLLADGKKEAGIYAAAYRLLDAVNMVGLLFVGLLLPMFARLLKEKQPFAPLLQMSARIMFCGTISVAIAVCFFRVEIMDLLYEHTDIYAADVLGLLIFTFILVGGGYIYGTLLTANNSLKQLNYLFFVSVLLNIGLNFYCIPKWGALGAAGTTLITQLFAFIGQILVAHTLLQLKTDILLIGQVLGFAFLMLCITYLGYWHFPFGWILNFLLVLLFGGMLGFSIRLVKLGWFAALVQKK